MDANNAYNRIVREQYQYAASGGNGVDFRRALNGPLVQTSSNQAASRAGGKPQNSLTVTQMRVIFMCM